VVRRMVVVVAGCEGEGLLSALMALCCCSSLNCCCCNFS